MNTPNPLYILIHALDKNEKRYFRLFSEFQKGSKAYQRLFDCILEQAEYDEKGLISAFRREKFAGNFAVAMEYLYRLIMKSLRNYHSNKSREQAFYALMEDAGILYKKQLFAQCHQALRKAARIAMDYDYPDLQMTVLRWERSVMRSEFFMAGKEESLERTIRDESAALKHLAELKALADLSDKLHIFINQKGYIRTGEDKKAVRTYLARLRKIDAGQLRSYKARVYHLSINMVYYYVLRDWINLRLYARKQIDLMEAHPARMEENLKQYITIMHNMLQAMMYMGQFGNEFRAALRKLRMLPDIPRYRKLISEDIRMRIYTRTNLIELTMYRITGRFGEGMKLIPELMKEMKNWKTASLLIFDLAYRYEFCLICFGRGDYASALRHMNGLLNDPQFHILEDMNSFARVLNLIIHFELGNDELITYLLRSAYRYLYQRKRLYRVETILLNAIKSLSALDAFTPQNRLTVFTRLHKEMLAVSKDPYEAAALHYFDFISWAEGKMTGKSFAEIVKEKAMGDRR